MTFIRKIKTKSGTYLAEVKGYREDGKVKQKFIRYLGKEIDGKPEKRVLTKDIQATSVKQSLDVLAIDKIAEELKLKEIQYKPALSLVYSQLLEKRSINKLENWMGYTEIPEVLNMKNPNMKDLYESLADINDEDFEKINEKMFSIFESYENIKESAIIDVTDTYFAGSKINIKRRKGKDGQVSKLIQIGLAVSFKSGFPILHKKYHGNLSGMDIYKDMSIELKDRGISSMIMDRGMLSKENIEIALGLKFKIIAGLRKNSALVKEFIAPINRDDIYSAKCRVPLRKTTVFIKEFDYMKGKLIVVYNPALEVVKKEINFQKELENDNDIGYSLIYHNTEYSSVEVVRNYYEKDMVERAFKQIKGILNLNPIRLWLENHVEGHIKICYLAYAILSLMNFKLKKLKISAVEALDSLKFGYKVNLKDSSSGFEWGIYVPLEPKQKKILKELGVVYKN
jgi:transposase